ncbi:hypothetical protein MLD38_014393 [Melastoma candidum]|uniref:Uncharacterized protein n=1 Tax=Melastoma candidum TaxID=119954 RepID=A0ACB9RD66_9MYRT|nr:hypothetical protein MLD38_014393 [Melastoma candidum]
MLFGKKLTYRSRGYGASLPVIPMKLAVNLLPSLMKSSSLPKNYLSRGIAVAPKMIAAVQVPRRKQTPSASSLLILILWVS